MSLCTISYRLCLSGLSLAIICLLNACCINLLSIFAIEYFYVNSLFSPIIKFILAKCLALEVNVRIRGIDMVMSLEGITREHGFSKLIKVDNGPEYISKDLDRWAYWNHVELDFSCPGIPSDHALVETFNSRFRQECLNQHWF